MLWITRAMEIDSVLLHVFPDICSFQAQIKYLNIKIRQKMRFLTVGWHFPHSHLLSFSDFGGSWEMIKGFFFCWIMVMILWPPSYAVAFWPVCYVTAMEQISCYIYTGLDRHRHHYWWKLYFSFIWQCISLCRSSSVIITSNSFTFLHEFETAFVVAVNQFLLDHSNPKMVFNSM